MPNQKGQTSVILGYEMYEVIRYLQYKWRARSAGDVIRRLLSESPEILKTANELKIKLPDPSSFEWGGDRKSADKDDHEEKEA